MHKITVHVVLCGCEILSLSFCSFTFREFENRALFFQLRDRGSHWRMEKTAFSGS